MGVQLLASHHRLRKERKITHSRGRIQTSAHPQAHPYKEQKVHQANQPLSYGLTYKCSVPGWPQMPHSDSSQLPPHYLWYMLFTRQPFKLKIHHNSQQFPNYKPQIILFSTCFILLWLFLSISSSPILKFYLVHFSNLFWDLTQIKAWLSSSFHGYTFKLTDISMKI